MLFVCIFFLPFWIKLIRFQIGSRVSEVILLCLLCLFVCSQYVY